MPQDSRVEKELKRHAVAFAKLAGNKAPETLPDKLAAPSAMSAAWLRSRRRDSLITETLRPYHAKLTARGSNAF